MLVASDSGKILLLPALPQKFSKGSIEGVLCRGQVEIKNLSWNNKKVTVSLVSKKNQKLTLVLPSKIESINITNGVGKVEKSKQLNERIISLQSGDVLTMDLDIL